MIVNSKPVAGIALGLCLGLLVHGAGAAQPPITSVAFAPDGKSAIACSQVGLQVYSWPELKRDRTIKTTAVNLHDVAFSPSGDRLAVGGGTPSEDGSVEIFSWPTGKSLAVLDGHENSVMGLAWLGESSLAAAGLDHNVILWNTRTGSPGRRLEGHSRGVSSLCFLKKENILVSTGIDRSLRVWKPGTGELIRSLSIHTRRVHNLALRPGTGELPMVASVSDDRTGLPGSPESATRLDVLVSHVVTHVVLRQSIHAEVHAREIGASGDYIPADATTGDLVERRYLPGQQIRVIGVGAECRDDADAGSYLSHQGGDNGLILAWDRDSPPQIHLARTIDRLANRSAVLEQDIVEASTLQRARHVEE